MADEAQIIYEYVNGSDVSIRTNDLNIAYPRLHVQRTVRPDGNIYVDDPGISQRIFTGTGIITGTDQNEMNTVQTGAISFDGSFPRIKKIYFTGATTISNVVVELTAFTADDLGFGFWNVSFTMTEYTA